MKKLLVFLTDPLVRLWAKGEIKPRYYNPEDLFSEVHFVSPAVEEISVERAQVLVGKGRPVLHPLGPRYYATAFLARGRLAATVRSIGPDVIRAYDPGLRGSLAVRWARRLGVPSVLSLHADLDDQRRHEGRPLHRARRLLERYAIHRADLVICVSAYVERYARRYGARRAAVVYNRVDPAQFAPNGAVRAGGPLRVLSIARLVPQKYPECLIRAVRELDVTLTLIGDGEDRARLERLVRELGLETRVTFVRAVPHAEIAASYHGADVFAIATHYEGFCIPVLEAMAAGLPVVASRVGPIEEILGDSGLLVDNVPTAFAEALRELMAHPARRHQLGVLARARAFQLAAGRMEARERELYESVLARG